MAKLSDGLRALAGTFTGIVLSLLFCSSAQAALLHYDVSFSNYFGDGHGYILADTDHDAIVGAHLSKNNLGDANYFSLTWRGFQPLSLNPLYVPIYNIAQTSPFDVVNDHNGEEGTLLFRFWLGGADLSKPLASQLDKTISIEDFSELYFPSFSDLRGVPLLTHLDRPFEVPEPSHSWSLLLFGLLVLAFKATGKSEQI